MRQLELTEESKQNYEIVLDNGETFLFYIYFLFQQQKWYYDIEYNNIISKGNALNTFPNIVRHYKNIFPFGLFVSNNENLDPYALDNFTTGAVEIFLLSQEEVEEVENLYFK